MAQPGMTIVSSRKLVLCCRGRTEIGARIVFATTAPRPIVARLPTGCLGSKWRWKNNTGDFGCILRWLGRIHFYKQVVDGLASVVAPGRWMSLPQPLAT
eukprot:4771539-Alexandrium_andersonii.AAC.1